MGENEPCKNKNAFETAKKVMKEVGKMVSKRRFERIYIWFSCESYMKHKDVPEFKEKFVHGIKHIETDKFDNFILIGCESDSLDENVRLLKVWSKNFYK